MKVKEKLVIGDIIDGSAIVHKKEEMNLVKGLMFENGSTKFFDAISELLPLGQDLLSSDMMPIQ